MQYTVYFRNWYNNHCDPDTPEFFDTKKEAFNRVRQMNNFTTEHIGNNNYVCNGCECWVEWMEDGEIKRWNP